MKKPKRFRMVITTIIVFVCISVLLHMYAMMAGIAQSGNGSKGGHILAEILFYVAYGPSIFLKAYPTTMTTDNVEVFDGQAGFLNPIVLTINASAWAILGAIIGALTSLILKWRKRKHVN